MAQKRKFIEVRIPLIRKTTEVLGPIESLKNKNIKVDLTRTLKGKSTEGVFTIMTDSEKPFAYPRKITLMKSYLKRIMRKNASYVEDSFEVQCSDIRAKIKPFLITRKKVSRAIKNNLRKTSREFITEYVKDKDYIDICEKSLRGELQKSMLPKLKKIYPLSLCEIRTIETKDIANANKPSEDTENIPEEAPDETKEDEEEDKIEEKDEETSTEKAEEIKENNESKEE